MIIAVGPGQIVLWDVASRTALQTCDPGVTRTHALAFCPEGFTLVTCREDHAAHWWSCETGQEMYRVESRFSIRPGAAFSADTSLLATSTRDGYLRLWDTANGKLRSVFGTPSLQDEGVAIDAHADMFLSWSQASIGSGSLHLWQPALHTRENLSGTQQWVYQAALSLDKKMAAAICGDKKVRLWSLNEPLANQRGLVYRQPQTTLDTVTEARAPLAFSPDGHFLATISEDQCIQICDTSTFVCAHTLQGKTHTITSLVFSVDGQFIAAGSVEGSVHLWHVSDGQISRVDQDMQGSPLHLAFDAGGERLGTISDEGEIRVWHLNNNIAVTPDGEQGIRERAYALDGSPLSPESQEESIWLWELAPTVTRYTITSKNLQFLNIAFRPDGYLLAAGYGSGHTHIWRLEQITL